LKHNFDVSKVISQTPSYEVKGEEEWLWVCNMKISKTSPKLHFDVTNKDLGLVFHFRILNVFKCWSNLGFYQNSNMHKKIEKPVHIVFLCHILTIEVDKQGLSTLE
jgi:hypothetical protein